jgi:hypothetical protein
MAGAIFLPVIACEKSDLIELAAVGGAAALAAALAPLAPGRLWAGEAVLFASGLFLLQSLLRDVAIWLAARRAGASAPARTPGACPCVESTLAARGFYLARR